MKLRIAKSVRRAVSLLVFAFVVQVFVIPQIGGARKALAVLGEINPLLVALAVVLEAAAYLVYARLTQLLLPVEVRPRLGVAFGTVMASTGVNHVVPGGAATTTAVNYRLLGNAGVPADALGFALGTQAIGSAVVLNLILWVALVVSIPISGFQPLYGTVATIGAVLITGFSLVVVALLRGRVAVADRLASVVGRLPKVEPEAVRRTILGLAAQVETLARDPSRLRAVVAMAAANWLLDAAALWVMLSAFGHRPGVVGLLVAYGLANVIAAVPISPGGLGVIEAVLIPTLVGFGTPRAEASIGVVAYRLLNFWLPIPVGAVSYVAVERANASGERRRFRDEISEQLAEEESPRDQSAPDHDAGS